MNCSCTKNKSHSYMAAFSISLGCSLALLATVSAADESSSVAEMQQEATAASDSTVHVTLEEALAWALERNPRLAAFSWEMRAAEARELQAGLRPNPELTIEVENVGVGGSSATRSVETALGLDWDDGTPAPAAARSWQRESGAASGISEAEFTLSLSQVIELGGKRTQRLLAAARGRDVAAWDYEVARADVLADTAGAFYRVLSAQQQIGIAEELVALAGRFQATIRALADAGKVSPLDAQRFMTELASARIVLENARHEFAAARTALAACCGDEQPRFDRAAGAMPPARALPPLEVLWSRIDANPVLKRWTAELDRRESLIAVEESNAVPDLRVGLGVRVQGTDSRDSSRLELGSSGLRYGRERTRSTDDWSTSLVFEASIPLPLFNRNQGNIRETQALAAAGAELRRMERLAAATELSGVYQEAAARFDELRVLEIEIIPSSETVYSLTEEGYRQGKFTYLDVLDSERTLAEARIRREEALREYHKSRVMIERHIGGAIEEDTRAAAPAE